MQRGTANETEALKEIFESINGKLGNFVSIFRFGETPQPVVSAL